MQCLYGEQLTAVQMSLRMSGSSCGVERDSGRGSLEITNMVNVKKKITKIKKLLFYYFALQSQNAYKPLLLIPFSSYDTLTPTFL